MTDNTYNQRLICINCKHVTSYIIPRGTTIGSFSAEKECFLCGCGRTLRQA